MIRSVLREINGDFLRVLGSQAAWMGLQALYFIILARALGAAEFGVWSAAFALALIGANFSGLGAGNTVVLWGVGVTRVIRIQVGTTLVYLLVTLLPLGSALYAIAYLGSPQVATVLLPLIVSELLGVRLLDLSMQIFQALEDLHRNAIVRTIGGGWRLASAAMAVLVGVSDAASWAWIYAANSLASSIVLLGWALRHSGRPVLEGASLRQTWRMGSFFALGMGARQLQADGDKYVLTALDQPAWAGELSAAGKLLNMAFAPMQSLVYAKNALFFRVGRQGAAELGRHLKSPLVMVASLGAAAAIALWIAAPLVPSLLGQSYAGTPELLRALSPLLIVNGVYYLFGDALMGVGRQAWRATAQILIAVGALGANFALVPRFGLMATIWVAWGSSLSLALFVMSVFGWAAKRDRRIES